ncbi:hypothetical protein J2S09_004735 [Bacillus fengqiuensis]|nr:hypothetical protein [Bacillus fengqiuensis]
MYKETSRGGWFFYSALLNNIVDNRHQAEDPVEGPLFVCLKITYRSVKFSLVELIIRTGSII